MKKYLSPKFTAISLAIGLSFALAAHITETQAADTGTIEINVDNVQPHKGQLMVALYDSEAGYNNGTAINGKKIPVQKDRISVRFGGLKPGRYAVKMFHDINQNAKLDRLENGMPTEPFGFSNNAPAVMGPASWNDANFTLGLETRTQRIKLISLSE